MALKDIFTTTEHGTASDKAPAPSSSNMLANSGTYVLAANTAENITVPLGAKVALFQGELGVDFWWNPFTTATIPSVDDTSSPSMINPVLENVEELNDTGSETFSIIAAAEFKITIRFF